MLPRRGSTRCVGSLGVLLQEPDLLPADEATDPAGPAAGVGLDARARPVWITNQRTATEGTVDENWLTIGIEEEFQIIDAEGQLRAHIDALLRAAEPKLGELVKREMLQSV